MLLIMLFLVGASSFSATKTITNSGTAFSPSDVTINLGDDVFFSISSIHDVVEVSLATYNANGTTPLPGGFSVPFGGGTVPADKLTIGIHYYVCTNHVSGGMKGTITVQGTTGIAEKPSEDKISVFPNPSNGDFKLKIHTSTSASNYDLEIYDVRGKVVYEKSDLQQNNAAQIDLAYLPKGTYIVKLFNKSEMYSRKIVIR